MSKRDSMRADFVIVGGGIAGISCMEMLSSVSPEKSVVLVTASSMVKAVTNVNQVTKFIIDFDVEEVDVKEYSEKHCSSSFNRVIRDAIQSFDPITKSVTTRTGLEIFYDRLCLCHGARPKIVSAVEEDAKRFVVTIRDTESVQVFQEKLKEARRVAIVGNGGIATELVYELKSVDVVWAVKDDAIVSTFVDPGAGEFFLQEINEKELSPEDAAAPVKRHKYGPMGSCGDESSAAKTPGSALGPDWHHGLSVEGAAHRRKRIHLEFKCEVKSVRTAANSPSKGIFDDCGKDEDVSWPVYVELSNGQTFGCDLVISAIGVTPNADLISPELLEMSEDGAVKVDCNMRTSASDVFAAGDVCHVEWTMSRHDFLHR